MEGPSRAPEVQGRGAGFIRLRILLLLLPSSPDAPGGCRGRALPEGVEDVGGEEADEDLQPSLLLLPRL